MLLKEKSPSAIKLKGWDLLAPRTGTYVELLSINLKLKFNLVPFRGKKYKTYLVRYRIEIKF